MKTHITHVMPSEVKIEESVLGSIISNGVPQLKLVLEYFGGVNPFYKDKHSAIFEYMISLYTSGSSIDLHVLVAQMKDESLKKRIGDPYTFIEMTSTFPYYGDIETHCNIVIEAYKMREIIRIATIAITSAYANEESSQSVISEMEKKVSELTISSTSSDYETAAEVVDRVTQRLLDRTDNQNELTGISSGFKSLDEYTGGWQSPDLIIVAARASVGKSAWAFNNALHAAKSGKKVGLFSLEMSNNQVMERLVSIDTLIKLEEIRNGGKLSDESRRILIESRRKINQLPLYMSNKGGLNIFQLRSTVRSMQRKHGLDMVIIDYLQLMSGMNTKQSGNREQEISAISRDLKSLAMELNIPIIALSQLSRAIENRTNPEPRLSDLRESGAIEQDADIVIFIARADYQMVDGAVNPELANKAMLYIRKHRNGRLGDIMLDTDLSTQRFMDVHNEYHEFRNLGNSTHAYESNIASWNEPNKSNDLIF